MQQKEINYDDFLNSNEWKDKRTDIMSSRGNCCEKCGRDLPRKELHLHHINYDKEFGTEDNEDLKLLCEDCHKEIHQDKEFFGNEEMKKKMS